MKPIIAYTMALCCAVGLSFAFMEASYGEGDTTEPSKPAISSSKKEAAAAKKLTLGTKAPEFSLLDVVTGREVSSADSSGKKVLVVIFMCRHCPYVQHVMEELVKFGNDYAEKDVAIVGISANDPKNYPKDAPEGLKEMAVEKKLPFPLLFDETQETAKAFTAVCTPEFFIFNAERVLAYRGRFDGSMPGSAVLVTGREARAAVDALLAGVPVSLDQKKAVGCSIKWKRGNRPDYR